MRTRAGQLQQLHDLYCLFFVQYSTAHISHKPCSYSYMYHKLHCRQEEVSLKWVLNCSNIIFDWPCLWWPFGWCPNVIISSEVWPIIICGCGYRLSNELQIQQACLGQNWLKYFSKHCWPWRYTLTDSCYLYTIDYGGSSCVRLLHEIQ